jgi:hypothetical protein
LKIRNKNDDVKVAGHTRAVAFFRYAQEEKEKA